LILLQTFYFKFLLSSSLYPTGCIWNMNFLFFYFEKTLFFIVYIEYSLFLDVPRFYIKVISCHNLYAVEKIIFRSSSCYLKPCRCNVKPYGRFQSFHRGLRCIFKRQTIPILYTALVSKFRKNVTTIFCYKVTIYIYLYICVWCVFGYSVQCWYSKIWTLTIITINNNNNNNNNSNNNAHRRVNIVIEIGFNLSELKLLYNL